MHLESINWTTFTCPEGYFEWLVMPFGLKIAPQVFQIKMDNIFRDVTQYTCVYIDDVLFFSKTKIEHYAHLHMIFTLFKKHKLIISRKKMKLVTKYIEFLGAEIGQGKISLQSHI